MQRIGKYQLGELLGQGGMGAVYRSFHPVLNRPVALKVMLGNIAADPQAHQRFLREAQVVAALSHPNIINIFDVDIQDGQPYIVMEYLEGGSLAARLRAGRLPLADTLSLAAALADALEYAHSQGLVHRDLKPANVLLRPDGSPVLADFGLARPLQPDSAAQLTATGAVLGTLAYMAPEQFSGRPADARADIYAFGVLLYEMLTGKLPFDGDSAQIMYGHLQQPPPAPSLINPALPPAIEQLVLRMLSKDPAWRPQRAAEVAAALRQLGSSTAATGPTLALAGGVATLQQRSVGAAPPPTPAGPPWKLLAGLGIGGVLVVGLLVLALVGILNAGPGAAATSTPLATAVARIQPTTTEFDPPATLAPLPTSVPPTSTPQPAPLELVPAALLANAQPVGPESFSVGGVSYRKDDGTVWFFGEVRNDGSAPRESIEVRINLLDAAGHEVATKTGFASFSYLQPGEISPFSVLFSKDDAPPLFASYAIEVRSRKADFQLGYTYRDVSAAATAPPRRSSLNFIKLSGRVKNHGARPARFVHIFAVFYDVNGNVVGVTDGIAESANDEPLAAGADARFELSGVIFSGEPVQYRLFAQASRADR